MSCRFTFFISFPSLFTAGETTKHDKHEDDPKFRDRILAAEREAEKEIARRGIKLGQMGACHAFWAAKKRILLEKHGIDWKSPVELNKGVKFD